MNWTKPTEGIAGLEALGSNFQRKRGNVLSEFSNRLRQLRESMKPVRSMTVTSQLMGLHPDMLRRYERGEAEPLLEALCLMADYYGVSTDYLLGRTDFPFVRRL
jgi:transcriptional regulator with XRE-family HTH domain